MKIQSMTDLEAEMRKVARGKIVAPADAAAPSAESAKARVSEETAKADGDQPPPTQALSDA